MVKKRASKEYCRAYRQKKGDVRAITGQHCNVSLRNNTNHVFSIFNKTNFEPKCSQDWKMTPIQSTKEGRGDWNSSQKFNLCIAVHNKSGRKKNELSEEEEELIENFLERSDITYTTPGRRNTAHVGMVIKGSKTAVKGSTSKSDTYFGNYVTY